MDKTTLVKEFIDAVADMKATKADGTYHWILGRDEKDNDWAIVLGWADGFEADENDDCMDGTYRLCVKLAYQSWNSIMQCDYEWDWTMPYDEESGEVDDTEVSIYPNTNLEKTIDWLLMAYADYNYHTAIETCPHCDSENVYPRWDVKEKGYIAICEHCGKEIFLCDECMHSDDNEHMDCNWCKTDCGGKCFRGITKD